MPQLRLGLFTPVTLKTDWRAQGHTLGVCGCVRFVLASVQRKQLERQQNP